MPGKEITSFADDLAAELRIIGLSGDEKAFKNDPLGGRCRTLAIWKVPLGRSVHITVYSDTYFNGSHSCWVGFGARHPSSLDPLISNAEENSFVVLRPEDWADSWMPADNSKNEELKRTSFTVHEDWRSKGGWVWYGRYFEKKQANQAIAFLNEVIYKTQSGSRSSTNGHNSEGLGERKTRIGQGDFRNEVIALWGYRCALTRCRVVPALDAAHIVPWSRNKKERRSAENGLPLLSTVHKLFEDGFISFGDDGRLLTNLPTDDLESLGLRKHMQLSRVLTKRQQAWMKEHRKQHGFNI